MPAHLFCSIRAATFVKKPKQRVKNRKEKKTNKTRYPALVIRKNANFFAISECYFGVAINNETKHMPREEKRSAI